MKASKEINVDSYKKSYWSMVKGDYLAWEEFKRVAIPRWMREKYTPDEKLRARIEQILSRTAYPDTKTVFFY